MHSHSTEDRVLGGLAHLGYLLGGLGFLLAFVIYLIKRERSYFVTHNARQAIGYQLAIFALGFLLSSVLGLQSLPLFRDGLWDLLILASRGLAIVAAIYAFLGRYFRYPVIGDWIPDE